MNKPLRFIHVPKTGGSSVLKYLTDNNVNFLYGEEPKRVGRHRYASMWASEKSYKFTVVRNPYSRTVSYYNYTTHKNWKPTFEDFVKNKLVNNIQKVPNVWIPQTMWVCDENNKIIVDKIFKLEENLECNLNNFLNLNSKLPKENVSTTDNHMNYYNNELKQIVYEIFRLDFEILKYNSEL